MRSELTGNRGQAIRLLGISERTFARLEAAGLLSPLRRGRGGKASTYDLAAVVQGYLKHATSAEPNADREARARRDRSQADLNELKLAREKGEVLPLEQVVREGQLYVTAVQAKLRAIPPAAVQRGLIASEQVAHLEDLVEEAVDEMSRWSTALELQQAIDEETNKGA